MKKKITGQSKLLTEPTKEAPAEQPLNLTTPKPKKPKIKNFRLNDLDQEGLKQIVEAVNKVSPYKKVNETTIIKTLIYLGKKINPEKILNATKEVF